MGDPLKLLAIRCADVERSLAFYQQILGRTFVEEHHGRGPRHYAIVLNGTAFELYPRTGSEPIDKDTRIGLGVSNLNLAVEWTRGAGLAILREPAESPWGRRAVVSDPDGRSVELYDLQGDGAIPLGAAQLANRIADILRQIARRPEMYVGSRSDPNALESVLWITLRLWVEASGQDRAFFEALQEMSLELESGAKSYEMIYRERNPAASEEAVSDFVLTCWRRIMTRLGILEPLTPTSAAK